MERGRPGPPRLAGEPPPPPPGHPGRAGGAAADRRDRGGARDGRAAAARARPGARPPARPGRPGPRGRAPAGRRATHAAAGGGSSCATSTSRRAGTSRSRRTTTRRRTPRTTPAGDAARDAVDALLDEPFGNWHVDTTTQSHQLRVTRSARRSCTPRTAQRARRGRRAGTTATRSGCCPRTTRCSGRSGWPTREGRLKPSRQAKYRQVEEFLRLLDAALTEAIDKGHLRRPTAEDPLRIVDLGCGNAYLTFAAAPVPHRRARAAGAADRRRRQGAVARAQQRGRRASSGSTPTFVVGSIGGRRARPGARGGARPARLRHRDRRGAGPGGRVGGARWCSPRRAATTTSPPSCARRRPPRRTPCSPGTASSASGWPTP